MIKFISILIICYFVYWIAKILFRMFLRKVTTNLSNLGQPTANQKNYSRPNTTQTPKDPKKKFYDPDKIEEAKFEELK